MKKFLKKSDKGFSLVELIVVIAIMAILVGVIAPSFVRYVGQSRTNADQANLDELRRASLTVLADQNLGVLTDNGQMLIVNGVVNPNTIDGANNAAANSFETLLGNALGRDRANAVNYPAGTFTITLTGTAGTGYSATVEAGNQIRQAPTTPGTN